MSSQINRISKSLAARLSSEKRQRLINLAFCHVLSPPSSPAVRLHPAPAWRITALGGFPVFETRRKGRATGLPSGLPPLKFTHDPPRTRS